MRTIYKYPLQLTDSQILYLPSNAQILTVQIQNKIPCLWAVIETTVNYTEGRQICIFGTGNPIVYNDNLIYISTIQLNEVALVFHVFELK